jgi:hypothetical protein
MNGPKRNKRRLCGATFKTDMVTEVYQFPPPPQPFSNGTNGEVKFVCFFQRRCFSCGMVVNNSTLGGHDHASAFYDPIYCYSCADRFDPFLPNQREVSE